MNTGLESVRPKIQTEKKKTVIFERRRKFGNGFGNEIVLFGWV